MRGRTLKCLGGATASLLLILAPSGGAAAQDASAPGWGLDLALPYGYFDRIGHLETRQPGVGSASDRLRMDGTVAGFAARLRLPAEALGAQPFLQLSGEVDASDAEDKAGTLGAPGAAGTSYILLSKQAGVAVDLGLEWQTPPLALGRPLRIRPFAGAGITFWDGHLDRVRSPPSSGVDRDNDDFSTVGARLGLEVGLPLVAGERAGLDLLLGTRADLPLGDAGTRFEVGGGGAPAASGEAEIDAGVTAYTGVELRFGHAAGL